MRAFRLPVILAAAFLLLVLLVAAVAWSSWFQTWAVRKAIASRPGLNVSVGAVDAGLKRVELKNVRYQENGAVLTLPTIGAQLPVMSAAFSEKVAVSELVAKGWTLDLSKMSGGTGEAGSGGPAGNQPAVSEAAAAAGATVQAFAGVFGHLRLPVDLALDGVQLEGEVILPESRGRVKTTLRGGGLGAGREGTFEIAADAALADSKVNAVQVRGSIVAAMDTPRTFTQLATKLNAAASGAQFPAGVKLTAGLTAARAATGETYLATLVTQDRQLVSVKADLPRDASRLDGTWKIDVRDVDVAPFAFGHPLPAFTAVGEGKFDTNGSFSAVHASGKLHATAARLEVINPQLTAVGAVKIAGEFDIAQHGDAIAVQQLQATLSAAQPVATVTALQSFQFNPRTGELLASDVTRELVGVVLQGVPLAWVKPLFAGVELSGGDVRGELVASARGGGMTLRSRVPLTIDDLSAGRAGQPWFRELDISFGATADYTPQGWQAEVSDFSAKNASGAVLVLDAKAGQLAGPGQPLKATGKLSGNLMSLLQQPALANALRLTAGEANVEFVASVGEKTELQAKTTLRELATTVDDKAQTLPAVNADLRADIAANGHIAFNVPIVLERDGRKSDVALVGSLAPAQDKLRAIEAQVTSAHLVLDDAKILAAALPAATKPAKEKREATPPWAGIHGALALQLKKVVYSETFEMTNVAGRIRIDSGTLRLEMAQASLGETGRAALLGTLSFDPKSAQPYGLVAEVTVREFDPGPLFHAANENKPATVEGKFDVASKISGRAATLENLVPRAAGEFRLTSKGGVFRGLPVTVENAADSTSTFAGLIASASSVLGGLTGRKDTEDIASRSQAISELAKALSAITYDQLSLVVTRDDALNATLKEFTLIAPEVRLIGTGQAIHREGGGVLEDSLMMEFQLRARGRIGGLLKYLGLLEPQADDLGYSACTVPIVIGGTLGDVDASETSRRLVASALEKSGLIDKAADWLSKPRATK